MQNAKKKIKQNIAFLLVIVFLLLMSYFTLYEGTHLIHECTGESCPVCHELHIAEAFTKQVTSAVFAAIGCFFFIVFAGKAETVFSCSKSGRNLIIDKVRMDD